MSNYYILYSDCAVLDWEYEGSIKELEAKTLEEATTEARNFFNEHKDTKVLALNEKVENGC